MKHKIAISEDKLDDIFSNHLREINLIDDNFIGYVNLSDGDKKALQYLVRAAKTINNVSLEQDHPLNLELKQQLEQEAPKNQHAQKALRLFNSFNGASGHNGIDLEPIEIFEGIHLLKGKNFYPEDLTEEHFHQIIKSMLKSGQANEVKKILSARTMVRYDDKGGLKAIDYTEYFAPQFSQIANDLELARHYSTDSLFNEFLAWQAQALIQNNEDMDMLADKHWAQMQDTPLEFTISRENYDDELTGTVLEDDELKTLLAEAGIEPISKDTLGARVGIINSQGTKLLLTFKEQMKTLANKMPLSDKYQQNIAEGEAIKQTMVDADLVALCGDFAQCRGGITTAENLPNDDKLSIKMGGGRRNVYHRQVRMSHDDKRDKKMLEALVVPELHQYFSHEADHIFVIGHENGHSLGPNSYYKDALGAYRHIIEENKADVVSIAMMPEYVKSGVIDELMLKKIYTTWIVMRSLSKSKPIESHRVGDLIHFNYLLEHNVISFNADRKLNINFDKLPEAINGLLTETIEVQLSRSPKIAKEWIEKYTKWEDLHIYIANTLQNLGVKNYIEIRKYF
ncbi:MAG: hypothetical protein E7012_04785 [Alphaproteobacteria bacterium]|nr:hypothetical protein [Alphaproteobacteria bacterium]